MIGGAAVCVMASTGSLCSRCYRISMRGLSKSVTIVDIEVTENNGFCTALPDRMRLILPDKRAERLEFAWLGK